MEISYKKPPYYDSVFSRLVDAIPSGDLYYRNVVSIPRLTRHDAEETSEDYHRDRFTAVDGLNQVFTFTRQNVTRIHGVRFFAPSGNAIKPKPHYVVTIDPATVGPEDFLTVVDPLTAGDQIEVLYRSRRTIVANKGETEFEITTEFPVFFRGAVTLEYWAMHRAPER